MSTRLRSMADTFSDAVWPSFYTGTGPGTHGYYYIRHVEPGTVRLVRTMNRAYGQPFWSLLREQHKHVVLFDVPKTLVEKGVDDRQIVGWGEHYPPVRTTWPPDLWREIQHRFGAHPHFREVHRPLRVDQERELLRRIIQGAERRAAISRFLLERGPWDLFITVFSESHSSGHQFWHYSDPSSPAFDADRAPSLHDAVRRAYGAIDRAIAQIAEGLPPQVNVLLFSLHGMESTYTMRSLLAPLLIRLGYQVPATVSRSDGPANRPRASILMRRLRDLVPQGMRDRLNDILPLSVQAALITRLFEGSCDWTRTRAVAEDSGEAAPWIRINLRGREPWGLVAPGQEYDHVCTAISDDLMKLRVHPDGRRAVREVRRIDHLFTGPHLRRLPDLVVHWERGAAISAVVHPEVGIVSSDVPVLQKSMHTPRGFLAAAGPCFKPGAQLSGAHILDLAPTLLYLLGSPVPPSMEGRVLTELIAEDFLATHPPQIAEAPQR